MSCPRCGEKIVVLTICWRCRFDIQGYEILKTEKEERQKIIEDIGKEIVKELGE